MVRTSAGRPPYLLGDRRQNMHGRLVIDILRGIEAQSIEMKLIDPITSIGEKELAHGSRMLAVEIDGRAPIGGIAVGEIVW